jgi:protein SCO1/2
MKKSACILTISLGLALFVPFALSVHATNAAVQSQLNPPVASAMPAALKDVDFAPQLDAQLPLDTSFRDESGQPVQLRSYFQGKPVVLAFVYYQCPMLCMQVMDSIVSTLKVVTFTAGKEYEVVIISFDATETPAMASVKKQDIVSRYHRPGSENGWHFLTGDREAISRVTQAGGFRFAWDPVTKMWVHASGILLMTPDGRISRYFYGIDYAPRDMRLGLIEAAAGNIGTPIDKVILYCYHFDPASGKYGTVILNVVRLGGIFTVALIAFFIFFFLRREKLAAALHSNGAR